MTEFLDLISVSAPEGVAPTAVLLREGTTPSTAADALGVVFARDDDCAACELYVGDRDIGTVLRETILDRFVTGTKDAYGAGDGGALPGMPLSGSVIEMACPTPGCPCTHVLFVTYDEDAPPTCPVHVGTALKRVP
jgi:hypothetical protein